jgi:hypothetical protein
LEERKRGGKGEGGEKERKGQGEGERERNGGFTNCPASLVAFTYGRKRARNRETERKRER